MSNFSLNERKIKKNELYYNKLATPERMLYVQRYYVHIIYKCYLNSKTPVSQLVNAEMNSGIRNAVLAVNNVKK